MWTDHQHHKDKCHEAGRCYPPSLEVVDSFTYLGSTITSNLSLDAEINIRIAKAEAIMSKLNRRVWSNNNLTVNTKLHVYQACVLSTLLYSGEAWTTYVYQACVLSTLLYSGQAWTTYVYQACVLSTLLYSGEAWTTYVYQACVVSTLLYSSEAWTTCVYQACVLSTLVTVVRPGQPMCTRHVLSAHWLQ